MTLYTLCLQPFLNLLERLPAIRIGRSHRPISVVAYADDVTIFLTSRNDIPTIEDAIRIFEEASGAHINTHKSNTLPTWTWNTTINIIVIQYQPHVQILGKHFWNKIQKSIQATWTQLTGRVRKQAKEAYVKSAYRTVYHIPTYIFSPRYCTQHRFSLHQRSTLNN
jgi:hypothetical protein